MKVKLRKSKIYVTVNWISDGNCAIRKNRLPKELKAYKDMKLGTYIDGEFYQDDDGTIETAINGMINDESITSELDVNVTTYVPSHKDEYAVRYKTKQFPIYVSKNYFALISFGKCYAKSKLEVIKVVDGHEVAALIMPMRVDHALDKYEYPTPEEHAVKFHDKLMKVI